MVDSVGGGYACVAGAKEDGMGGGHVRDEVAYADAPPPTPHTTQGVCSMQCHVVSWKIGCS